MKKIVSVIGLGYIGLPTASLLANNGYLVKGCDKNPDIVNSVNKGKCHIVEPDLDDNVSKAVHSGNLIAYENPQAADVHIICVPTPFDDSSEIPSPNIEYVMSAAKSIINLIKKDDCIILESTSPVGTTNNIKILFEGAGLDINSINIAYCPERVLPGNIMNELVDNDRIIGGIDDKSSKAISAFYSSFVKGDIYTTDDKTAEMCKLTENSFRDVNIAFANQLSIICDKENIDVNELINLANKHPRVDILNPGIGVGGHCIPVDPWFIVSKDPKNSELLRVSRQINMSKTDWVFNKIIDEVNQFKLKNSFIPKIACLGLAYKPNIDDLRCSPALEIVDLLFKEGIDPIIVEPNISAHEKYKIHSLKDAAEIADLFFILVGHDEFSMMNEENTFDFSGLKK